MLRFLICMKRLYQKQEETVSPPHLVSNNQGLISTINNLCTYPTIFPNTTMGAEWDCIAQILHSIQELDTLSPTIEHIKGHQDDKEPYEELPLLVQLNCDADAYANLYLQDHPDISHRTVHQFPAGECVLQLQQGTITRDIKQEVTEARNLPGYKEYVAKKSEWWTDEIFDMIDWSAHGQALKRHSKHRATLVKYMHKILPIGKQVHRYDSKYPSTCPSCNADPEDMAHFWKCNAPTRLEWRQQFLKSLRAKLIESGTGPQVRELLVSKL